MSATELRTRDGIEVTVKAISSFKVFRHSEPHPAFVALELRAFGLRSSLNLTPEEATAVGALLMKAGAEAPGLPLDEMDSARPGSAAPAEPG